MMMIRRRYTISSRSIIPSLSLLVCLLSIYLSTTTTVYAEQRSSTTTTTTNPQLHSPPPSNVQTTILPLSTNIPNDIPPNNKDKVNEVNNNGGDEWKLLDGEFSTNTNNKDDTKRTNDDNIEQQQQSIISDASSALAANYISKANYNPPVGSVANGNDSANNGNTGNNNSGGGWFGKILGKDKQNDSNTAKNGRGQSTGGAGRTFLPPPPPPPPMDTKSSDKASDGSSKQSPYDGAQTWQPQPGQSYPPNNNPNYNSYNNQNHNQYIDPNTYQALLYDLDESTLREMTLTHQIHNLSSHITTLTSESELLVSRVDVLTERLADSEANFHYVHNRNIELDANCTELQSVITKLQSDIKDHEATSNQLTDEKSKDASIIQELRNELRKVTDELESLACLVETSRFENEKIKYLDDLDKKKKKRKKKKKKSFWLWLFGFGDSKLDDEDTITIKGSEQYEEERHRAAQELARTTLLHALQTERNNVDELESALNVLQRNNTAIMDVVSSRDELIVELNERVAVFEEDKMVLKAALRQLQMEIKEEAPKTQQLIEDLEGMKELEVTLRDEMKQLIDDHEDEIDELEEEMNEMTNELNKTTNELEMIGLYVDQLEDRLATGAIARKELDVREKECERLEAQAKEYADEVEEYKSQVATLSKEQGDTKPLLEDLIKERESARTKVDELGHQIDDLHQQINDWKLRVQEAERRNEEIKSESSRQLFLKVEEAKTAWQQQSQQAAEEKAKESEIAMAKARLEWTKSADEEYQGRLQQEKAVLEHTLVDEWSNRLEQQRNELQSQYQQDIQHKMNEQLNTWEESKENEFSQRLMEEKSAWEAELAAAELEKAASLEDEIDKAASKVYAQLEARDISFGVVEPSSLDQLKDIIDSTTDGSGIDDNESTAETPAEVDDTNEELTQDYHQDEESAHSWDEEEEEPLKMAPSQPQDSSLRPQKKEKSRQVPFRSLRKAFSQATGMHGLIRPSMAQLRQEQERVHKIQQGRGVIQDTASDTDTTYEQLSDSEDEDYQETEPLPPPPLPEDRWQQY